MNKKVLILALSLLMLMFAVAPAMADPAQKIPVTAVTSKQVFGQAEKVWITDGGILHRQGVPRTGIVTLTIDGQAPLVGTLWELADFTTNTKTGEVVARFHKCVFTFADGSFEGIKTAKMTVVPGTPTILAMEQHAVLQGSGIFEGQTLMLSMDWVLTTPPVPQIYAGFLLIH